MLDRSFQLRVRLRENKDTARIPLKQSALTPYQERPYQSYADMFDTAPAQYQGGESGSSGIPPVRSLECIILTVLLLSGITTSMLITKMSNFCTCDATNTFTYVIVNSQVSNDIKTHSHSEK